ncbi:MAG: precorrin-3B synthase [Burkholderia sp.]|nr:precorrin-3B synthase [Burkholderia sp.]
MSLIYPIVRQSACPGLVRIVDAVDGGLCRIKLFGGQIDTRQMYAIANAACIYGSSVIEVTNRANLQIRGIQNGKEIELTRALISVGLGPFVECKGNNDIDLTILSANDDIRNIMLNPFAGRDPNALLNTRELAKKLFIMLAHEPRCTELSPKFSIQLDGGESIAVLNHPHDIWLSPRVRKDGVIRLACGISGCPPVHKNDFSALIDISPNKIADFVRALLLAFLDLASIDMHRMFDLMKTHDMATLLAQAQSYLSFQFKQDLSLNDWRRAPSDPSLRFGAHVEYYKDEYYRIGAQFSLSRINADRFVKLASLIDTYGDQSLLITPWKGIFINGVASTNVRALISQINELGLITSPSAPLARFTACSGSSGCIKGRADTKHDALVLSKRACYNKQHVHLSGCERHCALSYPADITLIAISEKHYTLYWFNKNSRFSTLPFVYYLTIDQIVIILNRMKGLVRNCVIDV